MSAMDYHAIAGAAQTLGLLFLMTLFAVSLAYALWPSNKDTFDRARHAPLGNADHE